MTQVATVSSERQEAEQRLLGVLDGIVSNIRFVEDGGVPAAYHGRTKAYTLASLRRHERNVSRAISHVRDGGPLTDIVPIIWGTK
jgi:hypothetical protein